MKTMKHTMKCFVAVFMMAMVFVLTGTTAEAATKKEKLTMYEGESISYSYTGMGKVKSVKSSKSKIVSAKKKKVEGKTGSYMSAEKAGKAKVTVKGSKGTYIYNITVKAKPKFDVSFENRADGYTTVTVKNKNNTFFDNVKVQLEYKNAMGEVVDTDVVTLYYVGAKKTAADEVLFPRNNKEVDLSKTTYSVLWNRDFDDRYSDYTKKVKFSYSEENDKLKIKTNISYKGKNSVYAAYTVYFYDASGNVIDVDDSYIYLSGSKKKNRTAEEEMTIPAGAVSYDVLERAMMVKNN